MLPNGAKIGARVVLTKTDSFNNAVLAWISKISSDGKITATGQDGLRLFSHNARYKDDPLYSGPQGEAFKTASRNTGTYTWDLADSEKERARLIEMVEKAVATCDEVRDTITEVRDKNNDNARQIGQLRSKLTKAITDSGNERDKLEDAIDNVAKGLAEITQVTTEISERLKTPASTVQQVASTPSE
jgi:methyl-accepting chemotaxis protein